MEGDAVNCSSIWASKSIGRLHVSPEIGVSDVDKDYFAPREAKERQSQCSIRYSSGSPLEILMKEFGSVAWYLDVLEVPSVGTSEHQVYPAWGEKLVA